jgi:5-methyltetrahydropteroyltriglutamate--homocysteine methyltransferase
MRDTGIPREPIGSIPRPRELTDAVGRWGAEHPSLEPLYTRAIRDTVLELERTGSRLAAEPLVVA